MNLLVRRAFVQYQGAARPVIDLSRPIMIPSGVHALTGPSGAGKSTFLKLLARWFSESNEVKTTGSDISLPASEVIYLSKDSILLPWHKVERSIELISDSYGRAVNPAKLKEWCRVSELADAVMELYPQQLSSGMAARCDLACALEAKPKVILIDETLALVEARLRTKIFAYLKAVADTVVIIATHNQDLIDQAESVFSFKAFDNRVASWDYDRSVSV